MQLCEQKIFDDFNPLSVKNDALALYMWSIDPCVLCLCVCGGSVSTLVDGQIWVIKHLCCINLT